MENKLYSKEYKTCTHLLLDGGKLKIPDKLYGEFLKRYAQDIENGEKHYIIEIKTPVFRLFADFDLVARVDQERETSQQIVDKLQIFQNVVSLFFGGANSGVLVCTADDKPIGQEYVKTGYHLIWSDIYVTKETALLIRKGVVHLLEEKFGERTKEKGFYNSWVDVVDATVYNKNGLRMVGARKMVPCAVCKRSTEKLCDSVNCVVMYDKTRKIDEGRPYSLNKDLTLLLMGNQSDFKIQSEGDQKENTKLNWSYAEIINKTMIRTDKTETLFKVPTWIQFMKPIPTRSPTRSKIADSVQVSKESKDLVDEIENAKTKISSDSAIFQGLAQFIKTAFKGNPHYKDIQITELMVCKNGEYYIARTNSTFCMNINKNHKTNGIYFYINDYKGLYQKCFCKCETAEGRVSGKPCRDYKSPPKPLNSKLNKLLFPQKKAKQIEAAFKKDRTPGDPLDELLAYYSK